MFQRDPVAAINLTTLKQEQQKRKQSPELLAEESLLIKRQMAENEAEKLKVQQEIAKAKARSRVFETSATEG